MTLDPQTPLVTAAELQAALGSPDLVILDIRSGPDGAGRTAFEAGHIPGAMHADYATAGWRAARGGAPGWLPEANALAELFGRLGLRPESRAVVVSAGDLSTAARVYWTLKSAGHARVSLLDGGFKAWTEAGGAVEAGPSRAAAAPPYPVRIDPRWRATRDVVEGAVSAGSAGAPALVDARGLSDFAGETKSPHAPRPGRLPGAIHLDGAVATDPATQRVRSPSDLEVAFAAVPAGPVIAYCNTGQAAATDWFVLSEILGRPGVTLYDGSMSDWTQDPDRPVETGPAKSA